MKPLLISLLLLTACNANDIMKEHRGRDRLTIMQQSRRGLHTAYVHSMLREGQPSATVTLLQFNSAPGWEGNVFVGTLTDTAATISREDLSVEWLSDDSLMVRHTDQLQVVKREQLVRDVTVVYDMRRK